MWTLPVPDPGRGKEGKASGEETPFGFRWGPLEITRAIDDYKRGVIVTQLKTKRHMMDVYVTRTGKIRIFDKGQEWKNPRRGGRG